MDNQVIDIQFLTKNFYSYWYARSSFTMYEVDIYGRIYAWRYGPMIWLDTMRISPPLLLKEGQGVYNFYFIVPCFHSLYIYVWCSTIVYIAMCFNFSF